MHMNAFGLNPVANHRSGLLRHHARHHAVAHFDHGEVDPATGQGFHDNATDEPGAELHDTAPLGGARGDGAGIGERPAGVYAGQVHARYRRTHRMAAACYQQAVVSKVVPVVETDQLRLGIHPRYAAFDEADVLAAVMVVGLAQVRACIRNAAHQEIGNGHARIRRFVFVADKDDLFSRNLLAQCLGCHHPGWTIAYDHESHEEFSSNKSAKKTAVWPSSWRRFG